MPGKKLTPKDLENFRSQLRLMLGVLEGDISHLAEDALGDGSRMEFQGDEGEIYNIEFSLQLLERDEQTAQSVLSALGRINEGTYGRCEDCEDWLIKERLRVMPHAIRCVDCQRAAEAEQR